MTSFDGLPLASIEDLAALELQRRLIARAATLGMDERELAALADLKAAYWDLDREIDFADEMTNLASHLREPDFLDGYHFIKQLWQHVGLDQDSHEAARKTVFNAWKDRPVQSIDDLLQIDREIYELCKATPAQPAPVSTPGMAAAQVDPLPEPAQPEPVSDPPTPLIDVPNATPKKKAAQVDNAKPATTAPTFEELQAELAKLESEITSR